MELLIAMGMSLSQLILRTDVSGMPIEWVDYRCAVRLYHTEQVAYECGGPLFRLRGGMNARTGARTIVQVSSIIATQGHGSVYPSRDAYTPPLNNHALFRRDASLCLYCGEHFLVADLSRDHVTPLSRGGSDTWTNVVTACRRCNNHKAGRTPEQAGMQLLAVPFLPTYAEYIYLKGRRVLADQMEYLRAHFPRKSPLHARLSVGGAAGGALAPLAHEA
jgi:5-methylcytosine-specific restriction endonuclease McrA